MKYLLILALCLSPLYASDVLKKEKVTPWIEAMKLKFEGHTYIHFSNNWDVAGSGWFHDPDCEKCRNKIMDDIELQRSKK